MASRHKLNKWLEYLMIFVCFLAPMIITIPWTKLGQTADFALCYQASYLMRDGAYKSVYNDRFSIAPTISWMVAPLAFLKVKGALYCWIALSILSIMLSCFSLCQFLGIRGVKKLWFFAFLGAFGPCVLSVWQEQLVPFAFFGITGLLISLKKKRYIDSSIYQFLLWLKPYLLLPLIVCELGSGQTNLVVISLLLAIIGVLLSCVRGSIEILANYWQDCLHTKMENSLLSLFQAFAIPNRVLNEEPHFDLYRAISICAYLILLGIAFFIGRQIKAKKLRGTILFTFLVPLTICLFSPKLVYDLLLIVPGVLLLFVAELKGWVKYVKVILILSILATLLLPGYLVICSLSLSRSGIFSVFFWVTLIFAIGALLIERHSVKGSASGEAA